MDYIGIGFVIICMYLCMYMHASIRSCMSGLPLSMLVNDSIVNVMLKLRCI